MRNLVLPGLARAVVTLTLNPGRLGLARGIERNTDARAQTDLARHSSRESPSASPANRLGRNASAKSTVGSHLRRHYSFALSAFLIVGPHCAARSLTGVVRAISTNHRTAQRCAKSAAIKRTVE